MSVIGRFLVMGNFRLSRHIFWPVRVCFGRLEEDGRGIIWKKIWGLKLPPKLALFMWKLVHRILPVKVALFRRNLVSDLVCPMCGEEWELIEHFFFSVSMLEECGSCLTWILISQLADQLGLSSGSWDGWIQLLIMVLFWSPLLIVINRCFVFPRRKFLWF